MVFPQTLLPITVEIFVSGAWTDITQYVRIRDELGGIEIERGRPDEAGKVTPGRCSMELDDTDLRFNPRNPNGPYYGQLGRNTPLRVSVAQSSTYLRTYGVTLGDARTPDTAALDILGDIDVRFNGTISNLFGAPLGTTELMGKLSTVSGKSWMLGVRDDYLYFEWSADGTNSLSAISNAPIPVEADGTLSVRVVLDVNNGLGGYTVTFYSQPVWGGPWTVLGSPIVTTAGTTSIFNSGAQLRIGDASNIAFTPARGRIYHAQVYNSAGTLVANPDFTIQTPGATSFVDSTGLTWSVPVGTTELSNKDVRFHGEVPSWPINSDTSGNDVYVRITASGILRRLNQGYPPLQSALRRAIPQDSDLIAYWPMEDESGATRLAAATPLTRSMRPSNMSLAADSSLGGSEAIPQIGADPAGIAATVPAGPNGSTPWCVSFMFFRSTGPAAASTVMEFRTTGVHSRTRMKVNTSVVLVECFDDDGTLLGSASVASTRFFGEFNRVNISGQQSGGNIRIDFAWWPADGTSGLGTNFTFAGTVGRVTSISTNFSTALEGGTIGHLAVFNDTDTSVYVLAADGFAGETAGDRIVRIASEESVPIGSVIDPSNQVLVGQQQTETVITIMDNAADSDHGTLMERRDENTLFFRDHNTLYNQVPSAVLNYPTRGHLQPPFIPVDDDAFTENDVTVDRLFGSSARAVQETGVLSTAVPPDGVGAYQTTYDLTLFDDDQCDDHAQWRLHLGTVDEPRYPSVNVWIQHMGAVGISQAVIDSVTSLDIGDRLQIQNPPQKYQNDTVDLIVDGYREFLNQFRWEFEFNTRPASGWSIAGVGDDTTSLAEAEYAWFDTSGSKLSEDLTTTETDVDIRTIIPFIPWTDNINDSPYDLTTGGETMTVLAPGSFTMSNALFDTNITGWTGSSNAVSWDGTVVATHPRAKGSLKAVPTGGAANTAISSTTAVGTVFPSARYQTSAWVYSPLGWNGFRTQVVWRNSAGTLISTSTGTTVNVPAGVWTQITDTFTSDASTTTSRCSMTVQQTGAPTSGDIWYTWAPTTGRIKAAAIFDEFGRTVTDTWTTADSGQTWTNAGGAAADYDVLSGYGRHITVTPGTSTRSTIAQSVSDFDIYCDVTSNTAALTQFLSGGIIARAVDANNLYHARLSFSTANVATMTVIKRLASVESVIASYVVPITHVPGTFWRVRFQGEGINLRVKVWPASWGIEPDVWHIEATDSDLTAAANCGMRSISNVGNTNVNPEIRYQNFELRNNQTFTVSRSTNGVVKAHSASADISLRYPPIIAL